MVEFDKSAISLTASTTDKTEMPARSFFSRRSIWPAVRGWGIALLVLGACSWGVWKLTHSPSSSREEESLADLEGFENAPVFQRTSDDGSGRLELGQGTSLLAPPRDDVASLGEGLLGPATRSDDDEGSHVRLTGTIEEDIEPAQRIEMPDRISGGRDNSVILR